MSAQLSPDGMYYWDGRQWVTTLSADGLYRWNGNTWVPLAGAQHAMAGPPARTVREPTSWTRPLQYAVAGWYALSAVYSLSLPLWLGGTMSQIMDQSFKQQQQLNPAASPPPQQVLDAVTSIMNGVLWVSALFGVAICVLFIVGALNRWTWIFYTVLVLLGLGALSGPLNLLNLVAGNSFASSAGYTFPSGFYVAGLVLWIPSTALFVWMLIAVVTRGPWGMRRAG